MHQALLFVSASLLVIIVPGPDNLSVISYGVSQGRRAGMLFGAGCATGCLLHTFWACIGLTAIVAASQTAFTVTKIAGALYLFYLAINAFRSSGPAGLKQMTGASPELPGVVYFRRGFLANALNPKVALFFLAFLPLFTSPGGLPIPVQFLMLGLVFFALALAVFLAIGMGSGAVGAFLRNHSGVGLWMDRLSGIVFVLLGLRLLAERVKNTS